MTDRATGSGASLGPGGVGVAGAGGAAAGAAAGAAGAAGAVAASLNLAAGTPGRAYVEGLGAVRPDGERFPVRPLVPGEAEARGAWLGLRAADTADVVATLPSPERDPAWWWCVERAATRLLAAIGDLGAPEERWPGFEGPAHDAARRCHMLHVALLVSPATADFLRRLGVPEPAVRASLGDLARHAAIHRRMYGVTGLEADWWGAVCLRGELVELGRLQYTRFLVGGDADGGDADGGDADGVVGGDGDDTESRAARAAGYRTGEECLAAHIPEGGPLRASPVDDSLAAASRILAADGGGEHPRIATCRSWLLDPQLAEYLPRDSNIVQFQRRFHLTDDIEDGDGDVLDFVFRVPPPAQGDRRDRSHVDIGALSQRTTMERAAVAHLLAGGHWQRRTGWLELPHP